MEDNLILYTLGVMNLAIIGVSIWVVKLSLNNPLDTKRKN